MGQSTFLPDSQTQPAADDPAGHQQREDALRARINEGLVTAVTNAAAHGAGPAATFNYDVVNDAFMGLTSDNRNAFYAVPKTFQGLEPAEQMVELGNRGVPLLRGDQVSLANMHEGMVIGIGASGSGSGVSDVGHVERSGVVYRDPATQQLMFAESGAGGKLEQRPLSQLLDDAKANNKPLFAGDLVQLAEGMGARPVNPTLTHAGAHGGKTVPSHPVQPSADPTAPAAPAAPVAPEDANMEALRQEMNGAIQKTLTTFIQHGTHYHLGSNNMRAIDCSSFVGRMADSAFTGLVNQGDKGVRAAPAALHNVSENQIDNVFKQTGFMLKDGDVNAANLREGMIIGVDTGDHHWDRGRARGIDHIVAVYRDPKTDKLMIAESTGSPDKTTHHAGPRHIELDAWLKHVQAVAKANHGSKLHLYATDMALLADRMGLTTPEALAAARAQTQAQSVASTATPAGTTNTTAAVAPPVVRPPSVS